MQGSPITSQLDTNNTQAYSIPTSYIPICTMQFKLSIVAFAFLIIGAIAAPTPANYNDLPLPALEEEGGD
ncbi:hypothetical protein N7451_008740 [Penicillium sp. IBT 35674x]|nr:hypothetical protein N7451_008740 [Penicillium sp. IBT 35674x]